MAVPELVVRTPAIDKGLKPGALGLLASTVFGVASTAPAYSLAATLGFVALAVGVQSPAVAILAFIPMLFVSIGYAELNRAEPDCGTTFTWGVKAIGPKTGWIGGWGVIAADVLCMASLAQVAGQYFFLLIGADGIGHNATSPWVLLVGIGWLLAMSTICYLGIEVSASLQKWLLAIEAAILLVFCAVALIRVYSDTPPATAIRPQLSWFNPAHLSLPALVTGTLLMLFIYWGWDSCLSINEETRDKHLTPGRAAVISTIILVAIYASVTVAAQAFAGIGTTGIGLRNEANSGDVLSVLGHAVFGAGAVGEIATKLLVFMVLSSAAACTLTTILPTARTTLAMAAYDSIPRSFGRVSKRFQTPSVSTWAMAGASLVLYLVMNFTAKGNTIGDSVTAVGWWIAFYYGLTAMICPIYYRRTLRSSRRNLWMRGILPLIGALMLFAALGYSIYDGWHPSSSYTSWTMPIAPHWHVGGVFLIGICSAAIGAVLMLICMPIYRQFFAGKVLVPEPDLADYLREE